MKTREIFESIRNQKDSILSLRMRLTLTVTAELILMDFVFDLINEASLRMPGSMGSALGIVGGLVLGQAAVSANLISPLLIIVVSVAGLGLFALGFVLRKKEEPYEK